MVTAALSNGESQHRSNPLLDSAVVLFDEIVQVLARSHFYSARKFAGLLHLPHCAMRRRIGVQRDLGGCAPVLHRIAEKGLRSAHIAISAQEEIHRPAGLVHGPIQVDPTASNLYIGLYRSRPFSRRLQRFSNPGRKCWTQRGIVVCVSMMPRSAIMMT